MRKHLITELWWNFYEWTWCWISIVIGIFPNILTTRVLRFLCDCNKSVITVVWLNTVVQEVDNIMDLLAFINPTNLRDGMRLHLNILSNRNSVKMSMKLAISSQEKNNLLFNLFVSLFQYKIKNNIKGRVRSHWLLLYTKTYLILRCYYEITFARLLFGLSLPVPQPITPS